MERRVFIPPSALNTAWLGPKSFVETSVREFEARWLCCEQRLSGASCSDFGLAGGIYRPWNASGQGVLIAVGFAFDRLSTVDAIWLAWGRGPSHLFSRERSTQNQGGFFNAGFKLATSHDRPRDGGGAILRL